MPKYLLPTRLPTSSTGKLTHAICIYGTVYLDIRMSDIRIYSGSRLIYSILEYS